MLSAIFRSLKPFLRPAAPRRDARSRRPGLESMEDRQLLTSLMVIDSALVTEGTGAATKMTFTVNLLVPDAQPVTVDYNLVGQTATSEGEHKDFALSTSQPTPGKLTFAPYEMSKTITVDVVGDSYVEPSESFYINLSNAQNAWVIQSIGVGTILDDDTIPDPEVTISDVFMDRGGAGTVQEMSFKVSLNTPVDKPVSLQAMTLGLTATAGSDFDFAYETITFNPGEMEKTFKVKVYGATAPGPDEYILVSLFNETVALKSRYALGIMRYTG